MTFNLKKVLREMCMSSFGGGMVPGAGNEVGFLTCVTDKTLKHTQQRVCHIFIHLPGIPWDLDLSQRCLSFQLSCYTALTPERASSETKPICGPNTACHSCRMNAFSAAQTMLQSKPNVSVWISQSCFCSEKSFSL